jgi:hypothetical protein
MNFINQIKKKYNFYDSFDLIWIYISFITLYIKYKLKGLIKLKSVVTSGGYESLRSVCTESFRPGLSLN